MAPGEPGGDQVLMWETCSLQLRLLKAIGRLSALGGSDLESSELAQLERVIENLEKPSKLKYTLDWTRGPKKQAPFEWGDESETGSDVSWASDEVKVSSPRADYFTKSIDDAGMPDALCTFGRSSEAWKNSVSPSSEVREVQRSFGDIVAGHTPTLEIRTSMTTAPAQEESTVEVEVTVPDGIGEGTMLSIEYAGIFYEVPVPAGTLPGSNFRVPLLLPQKAKMGEEACLP